MAMQPMTEEREAILRAWYEDPYVCHTALAKERALEALRAVAYYRTESAKRLELATDALRREREVLEALRKADELTLETQTIGEAVADLVRLVRQARAERDAIQREVLGTSGVAADELPPLARAVRETRAEERRAIQCEREAIAAWLRRDTPDTAERLSFCRVLADCIEHGDYER